MAIMKKTEKIFVRCSLLLIVLAVLATLIAVLLWNGVIHLNHPSNKKYPIRGVDVSYYQGEIDWKTLSKQDIDFAYIKATEESYDRFIAGDFEENPLWIRSVYSGVAKDIDWTFWQFSNRHVLSGYKGDERFIDMNVYNGAAEEFRKRFG